MKTIAWVILGLVLQPGIGGAAFADDSSGWKAKPKEEFSDAEKNFHDVMRKLLDQYVDPGVTQEDLYRAATAGMLEALNPGNKAGSSDDHESWNELMSPDELESMKADLAGKISGIGVTIRYDEPRGTGRVLGVIPGSAAEKGGLRADDEILSVGGERFKGRPFRDLVYAIRGKSGQSVRLKVLRDDKILSFSIPREVIPWNAVELQPVGPSSALMTISYFTEDTPTRARERLLELGRKGIHTLVVDLRDNAGGGFDQAIQVAGLFVPEGSVIARMKDRTGKERTREASGRVLDPGVHLIVLVNHGTSCGGELLASALQELRGAKLVGTTTLGKWNAQTIETLPNRFGVKFTVENFYSSQGHSYQGSGMKPDLEIPLGLDVDTGALRSLSDWHRRLELDAQLRAALELQG